LVGIRLAAITFGIAALGSAFANGTDRVDRVLVEKAARRLTLLSEGKAVRVYDVALGEEPVGPKEREGDGRTPEGLYVIDGRNPQSRYHRSLRISYPGPEDAARAAKLGVSPGGDIMIHGLQNGLGWIGALHRTHDWTRGCIAVTNDEIEEIWDLVPDGTPIEIRP
jgi:murein L,D-transpeptidase YafK